jgi:hypothetical protein
MRRDPSMCMKAAGCGARNMNGHSIGIASSYSII